MKTTVLLIALIFPSPAFAAFEPRCGTDAFGNQVCLDNHGVVTRPEIGASGVSATEPNTPRDETKKPQRCGIDPFGNRVCSP